jgi:hypothetical protein
MYLIQLDPRANCNEIAFYNVDWCDTGIRHQIMVVNTVQFSILGLFLFSFVDMIAAITPEEILLYALLDQNQFRIIVN